LGQHWEREFCRLAARFRKAFTPHQIGLADAASWYRQEGDQWRQALLPDVTIWTCPGEHHEIKHKRPTETGHFGLEKYRLDALLSFQAEVKQRVLYTIHNWALAGAVESGAAMANRLEHWQTVDVLTLDQYIAEHALPTVPMKTYVKAKPTVRPGYYWPASLWIPLARWWFEIS
jgi:hypothetical protein